MFGDKVGHALQPKRSIQLDVLRAIAILLVIGAHLKITAPDGLVGSIAWAWHEWGGFGVPLFFTLSGYLVGGLLIVEIRRNGSIDVGRFLIRRGLKIYPAYFAFLAYLIVMPLLKGTATLPELLSDYWANMLFLQNYIGPNPALHTWSLAVEEHFYITLPFILLILVRVGLWQRLATICLLAPVIGTLLRWLCAAFGDPYIQETTMAATHLWVDALLVGVGIRALAEFSPTSFASLHVWRWSLIILGIAIISTLAVNMPTINGVSLYRILPIRAAAAATILIGVLHLSMTTWAHRLLAWVGLYSYSTYLWHVTIIGFLSRQLAAIPGEGGALHFVVAATLITIAAVLFGALMSHFVEWPVLAVRDRLFPSRSGDTEQPELLATNKIKTQLERLTA